MLDLVMSEKEPNTLFVFLRFPDPKSETPQRSMPSMPPGYGVWRQKREKVIFPILEQSDVLIMDHDALVYWEKYRFAGFHLKQQP